MACKTNDTAKVKELIEQETPVNYRDLESGWSPLHWASCNGNVELVELQTSGVAPAAKLLITGSGSTINSVRVEIAQRLKRNFPTLANVTWD